MKRSKNSENSTPNYIDHDQKDPLLEEYEGLDINRRESIFGSKNPYEKSGFISRWLFSWVTPLVRFGYSEKLRLEHLGELPSNYHTSIQEDRVRLYWERYKHRSGYPLIWAICMAYKGEFFYAFFLSFLSSLPEIASPFVIQEFLRFIDEPDIELWYGIMFGLLYVLSMFLSRVIMEQGTFYQMQLGSKCSAGVTGLIYSKSLLISSATNKQFTQGEIVNFLQVDAKKIIVFAWRLPALAKLPIILIYCIAMCFWYFNYTFYSGMIFIVVAIVMNYVLAIFTARRQKSVLNAKDKRMRIITETINSIKIIKLNSWIERFIGNIKKSRDHEVLMLILRFSITCINFLAIFLVPPLFSLTVFSVAIKSGVKMSVSTAFAALQVLNMLRDPTRWLPFFIGMMMEFSVSMKRIQNFLKAQEINQLLIKQDKDYDNPYAITMTPSNFSWGGEKIDDNEEKDKKKKAKKQNESEDETSVTAINKGINDEESFASEEETKSEISPDNSDSNDEAQESKKEMKIKDIITLRSINLSVAKGEFICIIGEVGSGKSSLISSLLGDLIYVSDETAQSLGEKPVDDESLNDLFYYSRKQNIITTSGSISYVQQVPWIQNKSLRENILFGQPLDEDRYNHTIEVCQLAKDFEILDGGDLTEIGEKGINLSGGQKARVSLARAVYAEKDIILMDDPISALDANVKKKIFDEVFLGDLKHKTRILVTHAVDFLDKVDRIIIMDHCRIKYMGTYEELKDNEVIQHIIETLKKVSTKEQEDEELEAQELELARKVSSEGSNHSGGFDLDDDQNNTAQTHENRTRKMSYLSTKKSNITTDEYQEKVEADWGVYWKFFITDYSWVSLCLSIPIYTAYAWCGIESTRYIGEWIRATEEGGDFEKYFIIILLYSLGFGGCVTIGFFLIMISVLRASNKLHRKMVDKTLKSPINLYFDKTPTGKILNRFSKDINKIDADFPFTLNFVIECLSWVGAAIFVSALVSPWSLLSLPFVVLSGVILLKYYIRSFREMTRIETVTNSPILSNFGETLSGATTIRCFKKQKDFLSKNHTLVDNNLNAFFWIQSLNIWFSIRLQYISSFMMIVSIAFCIAYRESSDTTTVGVLLTYLLTLQVNILWFFRIASEVEGGMVSYDRCDQILSIPQEAFDRDEKAAGNWPFSGRIEFDNYCLRYRPETELVLKNLSFVIQPKEKVGIVGRTGAGKSTICLALCRIVEGDSGHIIIDGEEIQFVDLAYLRSKITIIPQDPTLFEGSLRFNLDPENQSSDEEIKRIISKAALQELWDSNKEVAQNGENLSSGEKQLICICRAILRKNKIILMDEATANIDIKTEQIIQKLIIEEFAESTVITIAHRLNTIIQSDKVLVLGEGSVLEYDHPQTLLADKNSFFYSLANELEKKEKKSKKKSRKR